MNNENRTCAEIIALFIVVIGMLLLVVGFNYQTIRLSFMGFSPEEINHILELDVDSQNAIMELGKMPEESEEIMIY